MFFLIKKNNLITTLLCLNSNTGLLIKAPPIYLKKYFNKTETLNKTREPV